MPLLEDAPSSPTFIQRQRSISYDAATPLAADLPTGDGWWRRSSGNAVFSPSSSMRQSSFQGRPRSVHSADGLSATPSSGGDSSTGPPQNPSSGWWRRPAPEPPSPPTVGPPQSSPSPVPTPEAADPLGAGQDVEGLEDSEIADLLEDLVAPYDCRPVQLSFGCFGPLSADTQVFRLLNFCGQKIEVLDASKQLFLKGSGVFKPVGYYFDFFDPIGHLVFSIKTLDLHEEEMYEFVSPHGMVIATARRKRFRPRTEIRVSANSSFDSPVEVECKSIPKRPSMGRYLVATPEGLPLGTIRRHHRKGIVTHQNFTVVVAPEVDPHLMVFLAVACNCINNERPKLVWTVAATGLATILI